MCQIKELDLGVRLHGHYALLPLNKPSTLASSNPGPTKPIEDDILDYYCEEDVPAPPPLPSRPSRRGPHLVTTCPPGTSTPFPKSPGSLLSATPVSYGATLTASPFLLSPGPYSPLTPASASSPPSSYASPPVDDDDDDGSTSSSSFWHTALSETRHFAGGLMPHPTESTKHFTILRHSPPLIFYRGSTTSVTITIFSARDHPLPPDRTLWLTQRGFSGDSGMKLKALVGATSTWLDVTPCAQVQPRHLPFGDERSWQRDIGKTAKRSLKDKGEKKAHVPRETHVVRIPASSLDGYFRLVLCTGTGGADGEGKTTTTTTRRKVVLCNSPVFRVASLSTDSSVLRGASLSTLPLEMGVKVASVLASHAVSTYMGPVTGVVGKVQGRVEKLKPGLTGLTVVTRELLYHHRSGVGGARLGAAEEEEEEDKYTQGRRHQRYQIQTETAHGGGGGGVVAAGAPEKKPFPLKFSAKVVVGVVGTDSEQMGILPAVSTLANVPDGIKRRLKGAVYFGWARLCPDNEREGSEGTEWYEAVITAAPCGVPSSVVAADTRVTVTLIGHDAAPRVSEVKMKIIVMGLIRTLADTAREGRLDWETAWGDVHITAANLSREGWGPEESIEGMRKVKSARGLSERYFDARDKVQRQVDRIPVHLMGIRTEGAGRRDKEFGNGGYWVARPN
ncbi:hypothetical protein QBC46DRAFT_450483 [Diplogelasinospora grovesii]|uniref:Riboflavin kinase n=1 Tax=Diplogelasinospora grovesii TaxID=303347 RepID=A0AAN6S3Q7_9PEZI|nr:hypothetical protein QBC46DRAFT_450483 [Diplogelasinospora grovesii]